MPLYHSHLLLSHNYGESFIAHKIIEYKLYILCTMEKYNDKMIQFVKRFHIINKYLIDVKWNKDI